MIRFLKIAMASWVLFIVVAIALGGGDTFRSLSEKAGETLQSAAEVIANKADSLKEEADSVKDRISTWTSSKKEAEKGKG